MSSLPSRLRRVEHTALLGSWDQPAEHNIFAGRDLTVSGWAISPRSGSLPAVHVVRDGLLVAETMPAHGRADVAAIIGTNAARRNVGWSVTIPADQVDAGSSLEVLVQDGRECMSLGVRRVRPSTDAANMCQLDFPLSGDEVAAGGTLLVSGWALFDGHPPESVEVYIGDAPGILVRTAIPRPDVVDRVFAADHYPHAIAAGFADVIPVPAEWSGTEIEVVVRARSLDGRTWVAEPIPVTIGPPAGPAEDFDDSTALPLPERTWPASAGADNRRRRVCVFTHSLNLGGGELYLQELLLRLARDHDFEIVVVTPLDGALKDQLRAAGIGVHVTRHYAVNPAHYHAAVAELATLLTRWQPDAVIVNTLGAFPGVDAALMLGLPVFWAIHESFSLETFAYLNWGANALHQAVLDRWLRCLSAASTVFESYATLDMYRARVPELRGSVVHYGIELSRIADYRACHDRAETRERLGFRPDEFVLLCMGVIQERKGQLGLVLAFDQLARAHPDARLVLVGDHGSEYANAVRTLVENLGIKDRVSVEPIQSDTYAWYLAADVLVSASDTESLPRSVLEAMAFGVPTLAADVFGLSEVVRDAENGWLCRSHSRGSLIAGLKRVLTCTPDQIAAISRRCEAESQAFDGANYAAEYARMIDAVARPPADPET